MENPKVPLRQVPQAPKPFRDGARAGGTGGSKDSDEAETEFVSSASKFASPALEGAAFAEGSSSLRLVSRQVLEAMRGSFFGDVVDPGPWIAGRVLLPRQCIKRAYQLDEKPSSQSNNGGWSVGGTLDLASEHAASAALFAPKDCAAFFDTMTDVRETCQRCKLVPLYHFTSPPVAPSILKGGLRMSTQGQGDGGVYFSTLGPASYNLGSSEYEDNVIVDCFGKERLEEYRGQHKLDVCLVYGVEPSVLQQAPGGRDNAKMVSKGTFEDLALPHASGSYFLRPDRILAAFLLDPSRPPVGYQELAGRFKAEKGRDLAVKESLASGASGPPRPRWNVENIRSMSGVGLTAGGGVAPGILDAVGRRESGGSGAAAGQEYLPMKLQMKEIAPGGSGGLGSCMDFLRDAGLSANRAASLSLKFSEKGYEPPTNIAAADEWEMTDHVLRNELGMLASEIREFRAAVQGLREKGDDRISADDDFADGDVELGTVAIKPRAAGKPRKKAEGGDQAVLDDECIAFLTKVKLAEIFPRIKSEAGGTITVEEMCNPDCVSDKMLVDFDLNKTKIRRFRRAVREHADEASSSL